MANTNSADKEFSHARAKKSSADKELSFEEALERLEQIAQALEEGNLGLDESLACYEDGVKQLKTCHRLLEQAERRIELLSGVDAEGNAITQPFADEETSLPEKAEARTRRRSSPAAPAGEEKRAGSVTDRLDGPPSLF